MRKWLGDLCFMHFDTSAASIFTSNRIPFLEKNDVSFVSLVFLPKHLHLEHYSEEKVRNPPPSRPWMETLRVQQFKSSIVLTS